MTRLPFALLFTTACGLVTSVAAADPGCRVTAPPAGLHLDAFYTKYCSADGLPIVAASSVSDEAVQQATRLAVAMMSRMPAARAELVKSGVRFGVIGEKQQTLDMPEYRHWDPSLNKRGRGFGAGSDTMLSSTAEENLLCHEHDGWHGENIFIHEFGHTLKNWALERSDKTFAARVKSAFDAALANGKYQGFYAGTNPEEYWAEGVQDYFDVHQRKDAWDVNTKEQLRAYDPALFAMLDQAFGGVVLPPVCPIPKFDSRARYRITNLSLGPARSIDGPTMAASGNYSGQYFFIAPARDGFFRLVTDFQPHEALDVTSDHHAEMRPSGQRWRIRPIENGIYRLTTESLGDGQSLEPNGNTLGFGATADAGQQEWKIERIR